MRGKTALLAAVSVIGLLALVVLYALELEQLNRTLAAFRLVGWSALVGGLIGAALAYGRRDSRSEPLDQFKLYLGLMVLGALIMPLLASLTNRWFGQAVRDEAVTFIDLEGRYRSRFGLQEGERPEANQLLLTFSYRGSWHRIPVEDPGRWADLQRGASTTIPMQRGLWGFERVVLP